MKRFLLTLFVVLIVPMNIYANNQFDEEDYNNVLHSYDLTAFDESLDDNTKSILSSLGIDDFNINSFSKLSFDDFCKIILDCIKGKIKTPFEVGCEIVIFIIIGSIIKSFSDGFDDSLRLLLSVGNVLIIVLLLASRLSNCISMSASVVGLSADFVYAFIPVFFLIITTSGGIATSISTNSFLLILSQLLSFISANVFLPFVNCFMAIGICSAIGENLKFGNFINFFKRIIIKSLSISSSVFISILSLKTMVASRTDVLGLRAMRFAINSVVPVVGAAISEGLVSIQSYSSLIKTSVGAVAIIAVMLIFLPVTLDIAIWRLVLSLCSLASDIFDENEVSRIIEVFKDTLLIINVILILSMITTIISFGILIAAKTG